MSYFAKPTHSKNEIKVELDLSSYSKKSDLKKAIDVDISNFVKKADSASLKSDVNEFDIDELKNVLSGLDSLKNKVYFNKAATSSCCTIRLLRHKQVCLSGLRFERYFSHHRAT